MHPLGSPRRGATRSTWPRCAPMAPCSPRAAPPATERFAPGSSSAPTAASTGPDGLDARGRRASPPCPGLWGAFEKGRPVAYDHGQGGALVEFAGKPLIQGEPRRASSSGRDVPLDGTFDRVVSSRGTEQGEPRV